MAAGLVNEVDTHFKQKFLLDYKELTSSKLKKTPQVIDENNYHLQDNSQRKQIITALKSYTTRVESYTQKKSSEINFSYGFWAAKKSRALNRELNYRLALQLIEKLENDNQSLVEMFKSKNIKSLRDSLIKQKGMLDNKHYRKRNINSSTLNDIIDKARKNRRYR